MAAISGGISVVRARQPLGLRGLARTVPLVALTTLSLVLLVMAVRGSVSFQGDFDGNFYFGGARILHGLDPYRPRLVAAEAATIRAGGTIRAISSPRYPAPALAVMTPLSLMPEWLAGALFFAVAVLAVPVALRLLGVRDWRCMAAACVSWPIVFGVWVGNMSTLVLLGAALVWRWRDRIWPAAIALAAVVCAKLYMWPLGIWLLLTRRVRTLGLGTILALAAAAAGWGLIGIRHIGEYPQLLLNVTTIGEDRGSSFVATLMSVGVPASVGRVTALLSAGALLVLAWRLTRLPDGDRRAYGVTVIAALVATPVAWAHYLALAFVPIALLSPQLSWIWFLPMLAGLEPGPVAHPQLWVSLPALTVELVLVFALCRPLLGKQQQIGAVTVPVATIGAGRRPRVAGTNASRLGSRA
jgi:hypothetical protein